MTAPIHRLVRARENAGLSVAQAAKLMGISPVASLLELEEGARTIGPDDPQWKVFADVYMVNEPWLRGEVPLRAASLGGVVCGLKRGKRGRAGIAEKDRETLLELLASSRMVTRGGTQ